MWKVACLISVVMLISAAGNSQGAAQEPVLNGIDVLEQDRFAALNQLAQKHGGHLRLAVMTNQTGVDLRGLRTIDVRSRACSSGIRRSRSVQP